MKYYAASLLAVASYALKLKTQEGCPEKPDDADAQAVFNLIDTDNSGGIDDTEGEQGLKCLVEWGIYTADEAEIMGGVFDTAAGEDDLLTMEEVCGVIGCSDDDELAQSGPDSSGPSGPDDDDELAQSGPDSSGPSGPDDDDELAQKF